MATQTQNAEKTATGVEEIMAMARQITKDAWLAEGMTEEEWERGSIEADVYDKLIFQGCTEQEAGDYLKTTTWEEIQRKHRELYPRQYANGK